MRPIRILLLILFFLPFLAEAASLSFTFKLPAESTTSAGAYAAKGKLVRTIWRRIRFAAGEHTGTWDGKDDYGRLVEEVYRSNGGAYTKLTASPQVATPAASDGTPSPGTTPDPNATPAAQNTTPVAPSQPVAPGSNGQ